MDIRKSSRIICAIVVGAMLNGCSLLQQKDYYANDGQYSLYYLKAKQLTHADLLLEIDAQKQYQTMGIDDANLKLTLLYSLPNAPIHNPFTAKARLNDYGLPLDSKWLLSKEDVAFFTMLRDQLNEQLLILQQQTNQETQLNAEKRRVIKLEASLVEQEEKNKLGLERETALKQQVTQLERQIEQLKQIEQTLNQRERMQ